MTKLNYSVSLPKQKNDVGEKINVDSSLNSLSKQAVINQSLSNRVPVNPMAGGMQSAIKTAGFGRTNI